MTEIGMRSRVRTLLKNRQFSDHSTTHCNPPSRGYLTRPKPERADKLGSVATAAKLVFCKYYLASLRLSSARFVLVLY